MQTAMLRAAAYTGRAAAAAVRAPGASSRAATAAPVAADALGSRAASTAAADGHVSSHAAGGAGHDMEAMDAQTQAQAKTVLSRQLDSMATLAHKWEGAGPGQQAGLTAELERMAPQWRSLSTFLHQGDSELADAFLQQYERLERLRLLQARSSDLPLRASLWSEEGGDKEAVPAHPYKSNVVYDSAYFTPESNPLAHGPEHDGKYFQMDASVDMHALMPEGPPGDLGSEFALSGHVALMVRPHMRELVAALEAFKAASPDTLASLSAAMAAWPTTLAAPAGDAATATVPAGHNPSSPLDDGVAVQGDARGVSSGDLPFRLLTGPRGIGKTAAMAYALYYARQNGWITLFVPDSYDWCRASLYAVPSPSRPGWADQPDKALGMLKAMAGVNMHLLQDVPQRGTYPKDRYLPREADEEVVAAKAALRKEEDAEKARLKAAAEAAGTEWDPTSFTSALPQLLDPATANREGATVADMVQWGIAHPPFATDCLLDVVAELKECTEHPVLLAVDGVNWFYEPSTLQLFGETVPMDKVSLASLGRVLGPAGVAPTATFKRGFTLLADSYKHTFHAKMYDQVRGPRGTAVTVPPMDRAAVHSTLLHYHYSGNFFEVQRREDVDGAAVDYFRTIAGGNPREVMRAAALVADQQTSTIGQRRKPRL